MRWRGLRDPHDSKRFGACLGAVERPGPAILRREGMPAGSVNGHGRGRASVDAGGDWTEFGASGERWIHRWSASTPCVTTMGSGVGQSSEGLRTHWSGPWSEIDTSTLADDPKVRLANIARAIAAFERACARRT